MLIKIQLNINKIIKLLIIGNAFKTIAEGFLAPIFAIFIISKIAPGKIQVAGFAIAIFWLVKSIIQIPLSKYLDKTEKEDDDLLALVIGGLLSTIVPIFYIFIESEYSLYLVQIIYALSSALFVIPWSAAFPRHIDRKQMNYEWSLNSGALGFGMVAASFLSGVIAQKINFNIVFILASFTYLISTAFLIKLYLLIVKNHKDEKNPPPPLPEQKM